MTDILLSSTQTLVKLGGVSAMTLWRWSRDEAFPQPVRIKGRKYFSEAEIDAWIEAWRDKDSAPVAIPNAEAGRAKGSAVRTGKHYDPSATKSATDCRSRVGDVQHE